MKQLSLNVDNYDIVVFIQQSKEGDRIALRPLCEALGLNWSGQREKLVKNPQFSCVDSHTTGADGKQYNMTTLPVEELGMFLCGINARRVKPEIRDQLITFQKKLQVIIDRAIRSGITPDMMAVFSEMVAKMREELRIEHQAEMAPLQARLNILEEVNFGNAGRTLASAKKKHLTLIG